MPVMLQAAGVVCQMGACMPCGHVKSLLHQRLLLWMTVKDVLGKGYGVPGCVVVVYIVIHRPT
jgi:hypothetical protein